jgi:hypothetical protein
MGYSNADDIILVSENVNIVGKTQKLSVTIEEFSV